MNIRRAIRRLFRRRARAAPPEKLEKEDRGPHTVRRWESADTDRLNRAHWVNATGNSINVDLSEDLETLRVRSAFEAANNPMVEGVISTHQTDLIGHDGPQLQVVSDSPEYNEALEAAWRQWFSAPTTNSKISGAAMLRLWIRDLWLSGEILAQKVTKENVETACKLRLRLLPSRRLGTPAESVGDKDTMLGIRFDADGEPLAYWISKPERFGLYELTTDYQQVPAANIVHEFLLQEEDQARGVPWLACALDPIGELRDFDAQVLDAQRGAADHGVFWHTDHPDANFLEINTAETTEIPRRQQQVGPPGWKPSQLQPNQPSAQYVPYRRERQAEIGRPASMPLMMIRLDSSGHNYSSARFDGQIYYRALRAIQHWLSGSPQNRGVLNELVDAVARELELQEGFPQRPANVRYEWTWPVPPHVDPAKEGLGERIGLENGTVSFADACMARGTDEETIIAKHLRTNQKLVAAKLPPLPPIGAYPKKPLDFNSVYTTDDDNQSDNESQPERSWANAS